MFTSFFNLSGKDYFQDHRCPKCGKIMTSEIGWTKTGSVWADVCTNSKCRHMTFSKSKNKETLNFV